MAVACLSLHNSKISEIEITVLKYESDFTKRSKDIKRNTWFSFPNDLLLHPDFDEISGEEFKWFAWIVSICSKTHQNKIRLNIQHAIKKLSLSEKDLFSMIKKLQGKQIDVVCDQSAAITRPDGDQSTASTLHYITLHNITLQNNAQTSSGDLPEKIKTKNFKNEIEEIYSVHYPLKKGKSKGVEKLSKEIKTDQDVRNLITAIDRYKKTITDPKFTKHFSTFATDWKDWLDADAGSTDVQGQDMDVSHVFANRGES